jgi:hypothetical protein
MGRVRARMALGNISRHITPKLVLLLVLQLLFIVVILGYSECIQCHSDRARLEELGAPWAFVTSEMVEKESHHPNIECRDCHFGNGRAKDKDKSHEGMLKMLIVSESGDLLPRKEGYPGPLRKTGDDEMFALLPKVEIDGELYVLPDVRSILWHDRDPKTFGFNPEIAERTCSKKGCHPEELKQFKGTIMGRNFRQRTMRTWLKPYGPHNCGPSFADIAPSENLDRAGFGYDNTDEVMKNLNTPFSRVQAEAKQKFCNVCHSGCLDCHYSPSQKEGVHSLSRKPDSLSCSGFGRGASTCHPGAMASRRGETYIGGDYSLPQGMEPDVHYEKGIHCIDCHPTGEAGMGDMEREASCQDCHFETEASHAESIHKDMDCATCHVKRLGGYQITVWGPGKVAEKQNPFHKYALYYGIQSPPIIMKDQKGRWMPVKIWPHSVGNIKSDVPPSPSVQFRWPDGETRDAYYIVGTFDGLPENNKHLLWMEIEQASHPFQKARDCDSCHDSEEQIAESTWEFYDNDGADSFIGSHRIVADRDSLRIIDIKNLTPIELLPESELSDFASWVYLGDKWLVPGDFSIKTDKEKYLKYKEIYRTIMAKLKDVEERSGDLDRRTQRLFKKTRSEAIHNLDNAERVTGRLSQRHSGAK